MSEESKNIDSSANQDSDYPDSGGPIGVPPNIDQSTDMEEITEFGLDFEQYKIAGSEARYRDQMLFTTFYLSLIALAVLLQVVIGLYKNKQFAATMVVSTIAAIGFGNLLWWSYSTKQARNRAWGFRKKLKKDLHIHSKIKILRD